MTARDYTHDPAGGLDCEGLYRILVASRDPRIKYVIWNRTITSGNNGPSPWVRRPYSGTNAHTKHLHLSVVASAACDDARPWAGLGAGASAPAPSAPAPAPAAPAPVADVRRPDVLPVLRRGSRGGWVGLFQKVVGAKVDEDFGPATERWAIALQHRFGLEPDGVVGPWTWAACVAVSDDLMRRGDKGPSVEVFQNIAGYRGAECDGDFGPGTEARAKAIQRWGGAPADGVVGGQTRAILVRG